MQVQAIQHEEGVNREISCTWIAGWEEIGGLINQKELCRVDDPSYVGSMVKDQTKEVRKIVGQQVEDGKRMWEVGLR